MYFCSSAGVYLSQKPISIKNDVPEPVYVSCFVYRKEVNPSIRLNDPFLIQQQQLIFSGKTKILKPGEKTKYTISSLLNKDNHLGILCIDRLDYSYGCEIEISDTSYTISEIVLKGKCYWAYNKDPYASR